MFLMQSVAPSAIQRIPLDGVIVGDIKQARLAGDESRQREPFVGSGFGSTYLLTANRYQASVTVDLKYPEGRDLLQRLAGRLERRPRWNP